MPVTNRAWTVTWMFCWRRRIYTLHNRILFNFRPRACSTQFLCIAHSEEDGNCDAGDGMTPICPNRRDVHATFNASCGEQMAQVVMGDAGDAQSFTRVSH